MPKLEKQVMKSIRIALETLEAEGAIHWYERLNSGKVKTEYGGYVQLCRQGTPDFIVAMPSKYGLVLYFIEAKSDTGKQSLQQVAFADKCKGWAIYEVVTDVKQVKATCERVTGFYGQRLRDIEL